MSLTAAANLALGILVVFVFALDRRVEVTAGWLGFLLCVLFVIALATALSVLLSVLFVRYRDVQPIWEVALRCCSGARPLSIRSSRSPMAGRRL